ncbi:MAG: hypothetical protein JSU58_10545, partial [Dehalococcoidales bacterium]
AIPGGENDRVHTASQGVPKGERNHKNRDRILCPILPTLIEKRIRIMGHEEIQVRLREIDGVDEVVISKNSRVAEEGLGMETRLIRKER